MSAGRWATSGGRVQSKAAFLGGSSARCHSPPTRRSLRASVLYHPLVVVAGASDMRQSARTEFPDQWTHGHLTNHYDVIVTITNQPKTAMQSAARKLLKEQFGLAWHWAPKVTEVLFIRARDPQRLRSRASTDFPHSQALAELAGELENYFGLPVVDETGATGRYDKSVGLVPARWVNGRTTDLDVNNNFLAAYGLELVPGKLSQDWLVMESVK